jgi:hypothetical protein
VLGFGNFSGTPGESDMLMRNSATNDIDYFDIQHNRVVASGLFGNIGQEWQAAGFADIGGAPGESDMVMRNTGTGNFNYFDIAHNQTVAAGTLTTAPTTVQIFGVSPT